jgi:phosphoribosylformylglycinamidine cyclo-ligase
MNVKKSSGIDIDLGNHCSKIAYSWAKKTFKNRQNGFGNPLISVDGAFSNLVNYRGVKVGITSDGIGTKIELAERTGIYDTLGFDLVAMVADDLAGNGIEVVNISNILDVDFLDSDIVDQLMKGLYNAANYAKIVITGGEIAELGERISGYGEKMHFNWCATAVGILPENREFIDGHKIKQGDIIVSLKSRGFRSNGFSLARKIMVDNFGAEWHSKLYGKGKTWGEVLLTPSLIYSPLVSGILNNYNIKGIAHITGGGIIDNLSRILRVNRLGALLDNLFEPLEFMREIQKIGEVSEKVAYRIWNMGNGMLMVVEENESENILKLAQNQGYEAQIAGKVISEPRIILDLKSFKKNQIIQEV